MKALRAIVLFWLFAANAGFLAGCKEKKEPMPNDADNNGIASHVTDASEAKEAPSAARATPEAVRQPATPILLEGEDMEFKAGWAVQSDLPGSSSGAFLCAPESKSNALTMIKVSQGGHYDVWTRSWDFADAAKNPGTRRYLVLVDGVPMERESGQHKTEGFGWELVGRVALKPGQHVITLVDTAKEWSRPDCILFAPPGFDPRNKPMEELARFRTKPVPLVETETKEPAPASPVTTDWSSADEVAALESDAVRMAFHKTTNQTGAVQIGRKLSVRKAGAWDDVPFLPGEEVLFILASQSPGLNTQVFTPSWTPADPVTVVVNGVTHDLGETSNPFLAGRKSTLRAVGVRQMSATEVEVQYVGSDGDRATGVWTLEGPNQHLRLSYPVAETGYYSVGFGPFQQWPRDRAEFVLLPPMFQKQRLPEQPVMLASATMPHPLALAQIGPTNASPAMTYAVAADIAAMPFEWGHRTNSPYGFSLLSADGRVQPTAFAPVLGMQGSKIEAGQSLEASFVAYSAAGDWKSALAELSEKTFHVTDYREPVQASLTDAALNMIDLLKDADASGWNEHLRGFHQIESRASVTHASPLTLLSAALLTGDPDFYASRALPTIEFTLSRQIAHHALAPTLLYVPESVIPLTLPGRAFGATYWQGLYDMTGKSNPWLKAFVPSVSEIEKLPADREIPAWSQMLADYWISPSAEKLSAIESACNAWITRKFQTRQTEPLGLQPFSNFGFYPYWWDLLDLYELTGNQRYLDAAVEGGFHTISGLWSHPRHPEGDVSIHPRGRYVGGTGEDQFYWKGDEKHRLGFPRKQGDSPQRNVPAWMVSRVGVGIEQPITLYFHGGDYGMRNILNNSYAPALLRLADASGLDIFRTYARNSVIGRFANYPGYYVNGFTDIHMAPDFPYKGPDISDIYFHHIPVHLGFTLDYIFTEAETLSNGAVKFPSAKQQGYVWFNNRSFGAGPGKVYGESGRWPWLTREAFSVNSPLVNYFGAVGDGKLDVVVVNSALKKAEASFRIDPALSEIPRGSAWEFLVDGKPGARGTVGEVGLVDIPFSLPPAAVGVFRFTSSKQALPGLSSPAPPVAARPLTVNLPSPWGKLHAMRIRSPFGKDSLYIYATQMAPKGSSLIVHFEQGKLPPASVSKPPYEISIPDVPVDQSVKFQIELRNPSGSRNWISPLELPGAP